MGNREWGMGNGGSPLPTPTLHSPLPLLQRNQFLNRLPSPRLDGFFTVGFVWSRESVKVVDPDGSASMNSCPRVKTGGSSPAALSLDGGNGVEKAISSGASAPSTFLA